MAILSDVRVVDEDGGDQEGLEDGLLVGHGLVGMAKDEVALVGW